MKKIIIASDSFKGSMSAITACNAIKKGIELGTNKKYQIILVPMADGGEGILDVLMKPFNASYVEVIVHDLMNDEIHASYGYSKDHNIAIIEAATTCGLNLKSSIKRDVLKATSFGLGEMIKGAIKNGAKEIIIGLGGTGSNDGGIGMLAALGATFYDQDNGVLEASVESLKKVKQIDLSLVKDTLKGCLLVIASDVTNPFIGPLGATKVFGKQKGATPSQLTYLEDSLISFNEVIKKQYSIDLAKISGAGAAGGIGGAMHLIGADIVSGIDLVIKQTKLEEKIKDATYIFTGEGSIDYQTINGKTISGIASLAKKHHVPLIAVAGRVSDDAFALYDLGVTAMFSITNEAKSLEDALLDGELSLINTVKNITKIIL